jgi:NAD(P)-dependent dehydrogenase (short-subunit alcohol dehydrogenase family)
LDRKYYNGWKAYGQAKTANMLFIWESAKRLHGKDLPVLAVHPGGKFSQHRLVFYLFLIASANLLYPSSQSAWKVSYGSTQSLVKTGSWKHTNWPLSATMAIFFLHNI